MIPNPIDTLSSWVINAVLILLLAVLCVVGGFFGRGIYDRLHAVQVPEKAAPAVFQPDGSLIIERKPDATAKPAMQIPKGAKVERVLQITVQASAPDHSEVPRNMVNHIEDQLEKVCPPVTLDLALVRNQDQTHSLIAKAQNGTILAALDTPVESAYIADPLRWAVGFGYDTDHRPKALVDYDFDRVRVGGGLSIKDGRPLPEARLMWRF